MRVEIDKFLAKPIGEVLQNEPLKSWDFRREVSDDLPKRLIHYVFADHKVELRCDSAEIVRVVFVGNQSDITAGVCGVFLPFQFGRAAVAAALGVPSASGPPVEDEILGHYGAWDVFRMPDCRVHIEYEGARDQIRRITLSYESTASKQ